MWSPISTRVVFFFSRAIFAEDVSDPDPYWNAHLRNGLISEIATATSWPPSNCFAEIERTQSLSTDQIRTWCCQNDGQWNSYQPSWCWAPRTSSEGPAAEEVETTESEIPDQKFYGIANSSLEIRDYVRPTWNRSSTSVPKSIRAQYAEREFFRRPDRTPTWPVDYVRCCFPNLLSFLQKSERNETPGWIAAAVAEEVDRLMRGSGAEDVGREEPSARTSADHSGKREYSMNSFEEVGKRLGHWGTRENASAVDDVIGKLHSSSAMRPLSAGDLLVNHPMNESSLLESTLRAGSDVLERFAHTDIHPVSHGVDILPGQVCCNALRYAPTLEYSWTTGVRGSLFAKKSPLTRHFSWRDRYYGSTGSYHVDTALEVLAVYSAAVEVKRIAVGGSGPGEPPAAQQDRGNANVPESPSVRFLWYVGVPEIPPASCAFNSARLTRRTNSPLNLNLKTPPILAMGRDSSISGPAIVRAPPFYLLSGYGLFLRSAAREGASKILWKDKIPRLLFRGGHGQVRGNCARRKLVEFSRNNSQWVDARGLFPKEKAWSVEQQLRFKFLMSVDGSGPSSRTIWLFSSNSLVFRVWEGEEVDHVPAELGGAGALQRVPLPTAPSGAAQLGEARAEILRRGPSSPSSESSAAAARPRAPVERRGEDHSAAKLGAANDEQTFFDDDEKLPTAARPRPNPAKDPCAPPTPLATLSTVATGSDYTGLIHLAAFRPWVHFIPVRADLSDLIPKLQLIVQNDAWAEKVAIQAQKLATERFDRDVAMWYLFELLQGLAFSAVAGASHTT